MQRLRRVFALLCISVLSSTSVLAWSSAASEGDSVTAGEVIQRIKDQVNCEWSEPTVDTIKTGRPDMVVTGVATTFMATLDVMKRASAAGLNFIVTHEPTFYQGKDITAQLEGDKVLEAKQRFIQEHNIVVWRFHDHWHRHTPDGVIEGMIRTLGWEKYRKPDKWPVFDLPETTVKGLALQMKKVFGSSSIRVVGDPDMRLSKAAFIPGAPGSMMQIQALQRDDVEVLIAGESREWETVEYARDAVAQGRKKALILLGHVNSEEGGMENCARWLKTFVSEVPVQFIPAGDPFWTPE